MRRKKGFQGLKQKGKKASPEWLAFSYIGYLALFITAFFGATILTSNTILSLFGSGLLLVALFFVTHKLEEYKVTGEKTKERLVFGLFFAMSLGATILSYHYLHTFYNEETSVIDGIQKKAANINSAVKQFDQAVQETKLAFEDSGAQRCPISIIEQGLNSLIVDSENIDKDVGNLWNPFAVMNLTQLDEHFNKINYTEYLRRIQASISAYNDTAVPQCQIVKEIKIKHKGTESLVFDNSLSSTLKKANWGWLLGLFIVTSILMLIPYFIAAGAVVILKRRKNN